MKETDVVISHLRSQSRTIEELLHYLESRPGMTQDDYTYLHSQLQTVIGRLKEMERFSSERGAVHARHAHWFN